MYIRQLRWRNCGPYGNILHTFDFETNDDIGELWQILGENGVGKSFFLKIIKLGLYIETDGILASEVSNTINGDGYIDITYDSNGNTWRNESIYGKSKLKSLKIYKNGNEKPEDFGGNQDTKKYLLEHILDMPYYIFNNSVSLSVNDFKSFLSMNAKDTRNIRDRIFGFFIVNEMVDIIRKTLNKYVQQQNDIVNSLTTIAESIETSKAKYEEAKLKNAENDADTIKNLESELKKHKDNHQDVKDKIDIIQKNIDDLELIMEYMTNSENEKNLELLKEKKTNLESTIKNKEKGITTKEEEKSLLDIEKNILSLKNTKDRVDKLTTDIKNLDTKLVNLKEKDELAKKSMEETNQSILDMENSNQKIANMADIMKLVEELYSLQTVYDNYVNKKKEMVNTETIISEKKQETTDMISELTTEKNDLTNRKSLLELGKCDKCETDLTTENFIEEQSKITERLQELEILIDGRNKVMAKVKESEKQLATNKDTIASALTKHSSEISSQLTKLKMAIPEDDEELMDIRTFLDGLKSETLVDVTVFQKLVTDKKLVTYDDETIEKSKSELDKLKKSYEAANAEYTNISNDFTSKTSTKNTLKEQLEGVNDEDFKKELKFGDEDSYEKEIDESETFIKTENKELTELNKSLASTETEIKNLEKEIRPDTDFEDINDDLLDKHSDETTADFLAIMEHKLKTNNNSLDDLNKELVAHNENIIATNTSIQNINNQKEDNQLDSIKNIITDFEKKQESHIKENESLQKKVNFIKTLEYVLSDECVKAYMLREIVPTINNEIANMLMALGVNLTVIFDDEFKPTIYRFGSEASLGSISTGQKKMVDASILMSITILILMRYGKFNLVSYDEIFSSLHATMIPIMLELIKEKLCKKLKLNVLLINHSYMSSSYFDKIGHVYHKDNFSYIDITDPDKYELMAMNIADASQLAQDVITND